MSREALLTALQTRYDDGRFLQELGRLVARRTESQLPERLPELYAYQRDLMGPWLRRLGYEVEIHDNPVKGGGPFLIGRRIEDAQGLTVLTYGHADVVRGLEADWLPGLDPWQIKQDGERIYGRGVVDNKGQHAAALVALEEVLAARARLGFNSIILIESSEEIGSPGIHEFVKTRADALAADILVASDGPRVAKDRPTIFLGSRGAINLELSLHLRDTGHHSGNWGGLLANPGIILAHAIAGIVSDHGEILVPELKPAAMPQSVRRALADITVEPGEAGPKIDSWWGEPGLTPAERVFGWNSFEVLSFVTGNPESPVNAVPPYASAHCQIRYTTDTDPDRFVPALRRYLDEAGYPAIEVREAKGRTRWAATRLDPDHAWARWAAASLEHTTGKKPAILPNLGGSIPNDVFSDVLGMPTIWIPHSYAGCSQHAPNEHALAHLLREGLEIMGGLFWDLGTGETPKQRGRDQSE